MTSAAYQRVTTGRADVDDAALRQLAVSRYGLDVQLVEALPGEVDRNVALTTADGSRFVCKISPRHATEAELGLQNAILRRFAEAPDGPRGPRLVSTLDGTELAGVDLASGAHFARLLTWVEGRTLNNLPWHSPGLLHEWGVLAAHSMKALEDFRHPFAFRTHQWDLRTAVGAIRDSLPFLSEEADRQLMAAMVERFEVTVTPAFAGLPQSVVHHDLNDFNVIADQGSDGRLHVVGLLDVGDAMKTIRVAELAIAISYAMLRKEDPLAAAAELVRGYSTVMSLIAEELAVLFPLAAVRLCLNAATWARRAASETDREYAWDRMRYTIPCLRRLDAVGFTHAAAVLRAAAGRQPEPRSFALARGLAGLSGLRRAVNEPTVDVLDLSPGSSMFDDGFAWEQLPRGLIEHGSILHPFTGRRLTGSREPRTVLVGTALLVEQGTRVHAPLDAEVEGLQGDSLVLCHEQGTGTAFWSCWRGLREPPVTGRIRAGSLLGLVNKQAGLPTYVHVQVWPDRPERDAPVLVRPSEREVWLARSPDPRILLVGPEPAGARPVTPNPVDILAARTRRFAPSQRSYYESPMTLVRASGVWFTDVLGYSYLDCVNNVAHVGHGHPRVVEAGRRQLQRLNTNSRFVYPGLSDYADRLVALLPPTLEVVFFVCTGSEANDLALRVARTVTGRKDIVVIDGAYHGNTTAVTAVSPNRYKSVGAAAPNETHEVPQPNRYRGPYGYSHPDAGHRYAADAARVVALAVARGQQPAAVIAESLMGTAGQIVHPPGYLGGLFDAVRAAGGLCISDEVQVGFGRMGDAFWGFEHYGVVPDIVTMGKPMGNGFPLAAVVTTRAIADAFDNGMKYFNTFGGNPVACAVGSAVLDVIREEGLQEKARDVGGYLRDRLRALADRHELIGDVRGRGLYLGVELVRDRSTKQPASREAFLVSELLKEEGVIVYPNGDHDNVLKLKPPMVFSRTDADILVDALDDILGRSW
ncbi:MAG TPA: aminotransferase class III-fold pyridoxal phosphate-dependent enzyme [Mycobacteriales bacterium]|nr:aminotransferase class III-fold pyridoxal phosphate-dependent enzyme [Mycobacteriales bacterium]